MERTVFYLNSETTIGGSEKRINSDFETWQRIPLKNVHDLGIFRRYFN